MTFWLQHQRPRLTPFRRYFDHAIGMPQLQPGLNQSHIREQQQPGARVGNPQTTLPGYGDIVIHADNVRKRQDDSRDRQESVPDTPLVVVNAQWLAEE